MSNTKKFKIQYRYSIAWLILWFIVFFPVALGLLITGSTIVRSDSKHILRYDGSRFWFCFWILFFFPVAIVLFIINGYSITTITTKYTDHE
jgi:hypothetical protein